MDPDILLIDEILAVGDATFQQKCIARIDDFRRRGKTIVFVSHSAASIRMICQRAILIHDGRIVQDGPADQVLVRYEELAQQPVGT